MEEWPEASPACPGVSRALSPSGGDTGAPFARLAALGRHRRADRRRARDLRVARAPHARAHARRIGQRPSAGRIGRTCAAAQPPDRPGPDHARRRTRGRRGAPAKPVAVDCRGRARRPAHPALDRIAPHRAVERVRHPRARHRPARRAIRRAPAGHAGDGRRPAAPGGRDHLLRHGGAGRRRPRRPRHARRVQPHQSAGREPAGRGAGAGADDSVA